MNAEINVCYFQFCLGGFCLVFWVGLCCGFFLVFVTSVVGMSSKALAFQQCTSSGIFVKGKLFIW